MIFRDFLLLSILLISCSKEKEPATLKIQIGAKTAASKVTSNGQKSLSPQALSSQPSFFDPGQFWNESQIDDSSGLECFLIFVGGSEPEMATSQCNLADTSQFRFGVFAGFFSKGQDIEVLVPVGPNRTVTLAGTNLKAGETCQEAITTNPIAKNYGVPIFLGQKTIDINGGPQNVTLVAELGSQLEGCQGPALPDYRTGKKLWNATETTIEDDLEYVDVPPSQTFVTLKTLPLNLHPLAGQEDPFEGFSILPTSLYPNPSLLSRDSVFAPAVKVIATPIAAAIPGDYIIESPIVDSGGLFDWHNLEMTVQSLFPTNKPWVTQAGKVVPDLDYTLAQPTSHLKHLWRFNGDVTTKNLDEGGSVSQGDLLFSNLPTNPNGGVQNSNILKAFELISGQAIRAPDSAVSSIFDNSHTLSAWIYGKDLATLPLGTLFKKGLGVNGFTIKISTVSGFEKLQFFIGPTLILTSTASLNSIDLYHIVITVDGTGLNRTLSLFLNGTLDNSVTTTAYSTSTHNFSIGSGMDASQNLVNPFQGYIDNVALFDKALTEAEIQKVHLRSGANYIRLQGRSCDDPDCDGEAWSTDPMKVFEERLSESQSPLVYDMGLFPAQVQRDRYFQYRLFYQGDNIPIYPEVESVLLAGTISKVYNQQDKVLTWKPQIQGNRIISLEVEATESQGGSTLPGEVGFQVSMDGGQSWVYYSETDTTWNPVSEASHQSDIAVARQTEIMTALPLLESGKVPQFRFLLKSSDGLRSPKLTIQSINYENTRL